jgi:hypothetical protein
MRAIQELCPHAHIDDHSEPNIFSKMIKVNNDPIPHIDVSLNKDFYNYCKNNWKRSNSSNPKATDHRQKRYNTPINDSFIIEELDIVLTAVQKSFYRVLKTEYPKWSGNITSTKYQFAGNEISNTQYKMRNWHLDNGDKAIIGLWYFKHPDDTNDGDLYISNGINEKCIPYSENRCIFIPNLANAWHKVGDRAKWTHERKFINIVVMTDQVLHDNSKKIHKEDYIRPVRNLMI